MSVCNHKYEYKNTAFGLVCYGGTIVRGIHNCNQCTNCGKLRWRIQRGYKVIRKRKDGLLQPHQLSLW